MDYMSGNQITDVFHFLFCYNKKGMVCFLVSRKKKTVPVDVDPGNTKYELRKSISVHIQLKNISVFFSFKTVLVMAL